MTHLTKWIGKLLFIVMGIALIVYAASRTLDFVNSTLGADDKVIGYLALFATTGGALAWLAVFLWSSEGITQKGIALVMIIIDVLGEITLFTIDTLLQSGANGLTATLAPEEIRLTVLGMSGLIGLNIIAIFAFHIFDSENMKAIDQHFREVKERKAEDKIADAITDAKIAKAESIADELATREADNFANEQRRKDRVNHALPSKTLGETWQEVKGIFTGSKKQDDLPLVAAETVGLPTLTNQPQPTPAQEEQADGANFQDIPESQNGGLDGGYIPTQEAV